MKLEVELNLNKYPELDLHGSDIQTAQHLIKIFIKDNIIMKNKYIKVIHGIGTGKLKESTHNLLKKQKNIISYNLIANNIGTTLVELNLEIDK